MACHGCDSGRLMAGGLPARQKAKARFSGLHRWQPVMDRLGAIRRGLRPCSAGRDIVRDEHQGLYEKQDSHPAR